MASRALAMILMLALAGCASTSGTTTTVDGRPRPTRTVLPNGVVTIVQEHRAGDVVAIQLWMRVGGRDEAPDELGLSHYLEHMLFTGTPTRPPGSIDRLIEGLGGQSNAFTAQDFTHYDVVLPARQLRTGLELLADIAVNASFDPNELEAEKKVVFEEMRLNEDNPERYMLRRLYETVYTPHAYGRPVLGTPELIRGLTRERLRAYYKKLYVARNMVVVVVGAIEPAEARRLTAEIFGPLDGGPGTRPTRGRLGPLDTEREVTVRRPERQAHLGLAWRTAPTNDRDVYAVDLLTYILGDSPSSRLNQRVRERDRLVYSIEAGYGAWELGGVVTIIARLDPANLDRAQRAILDVIRQIQAEGVTEAERRRAIVSAEANYAFDIETAEGLAKTYGQAETTWTLEDELQYLTRLRSVTAADIQAVARKYFGDDFARVRFVPAEAAR
jgi:zinc protease